MQLQSFGFGIEDEAETCVGMFPILRSRLRLG